MRSYWSVAAAIVVGFALLPPIEKTFEDWTVARKVEREQGAPVVKMSGELVERGDGYVVISISGEKLRECRYIGITAYTMDAGMLRRDANIRRLDMPQNGITKPPGAYDFGMWRIWPTHEESRTVLVFADHLCAGVQVRSLIAEVPLWT